MKGKRRHGGTNAYVMNCLGMLFLRQQNICVSVVALINSVGIGPGCAHMNSVLFRLYICRWRKLDRHSTA